MTRSWDRIKVRWVSPQGISLLAILSSTNMASKLVIFLGLAALSQGAVVPAVPLAVPAKLEELDAEPRYTFAYDVQDELTGDSKAQFETRTGDVVRGSYSLIDADGSRRIVEYTADPINGFNAVVRRQPLVVASAVAAAAPLAPYAPVAPVAPAIPAAAPVIPESGPDSDVEVVEARSGPIRQQSAEGQVENLQNQRQVQSRNVQGQFQQRQQLRGQQQNQHQYQQQYQQQQQQQQQFQGHQQYQDQQYQRQQEHQFQQQVRNDQQPQQLRSQVQQPQVVPQITAARLTYPALSAYTASYSAPITYVPVGGLTYSAALP